MTFSDPAENGEPIINPMIKESLTTLAEARRLPAWSSWKDGTPNGVYRLPTTTEAADFYRDNGFVIIEDAFSPTEVQELRDETVKICRGERGEFGGLKGSS